MKTTSVEYLRFGDDVGIARESERYLRTTSSGEAHTVALGVTQDRFDAAMKRLENRLLLGAGRTSEHEAESVIRQLATVIRKFLPKELDVNTRGDPIQLEIVTNARELAQLPFEVLEEDESLIVTRRIRQPWPRPPVVDSVAPRVLFAWAEPIMPTSDRQERSEVPHAKHLDALETALKGWPDALTVVSNASFREIRDAVQDAESAYTHIHVLAHGIGPEVSTTTLELSSPPPPTTSLALEHEDGTLERCSPTEIASIFADQTLRPAVFVLATCDSGKAEPTQTSGTLAHALHSAGVPVVIASQLALTHAGSWYLVDRLLKPIIAGEDPRTALRSCRDALRETKAETFFDRVAVVGYIDLPTDFEVNQVGRKLAIALHRLRSNSEFASTEIAKLSDGDVSLEAIKTWRELERRSEAIRTELNELEVSFDKATDLEHRFGEEVRGLLASAIKREAEVNWILSRLPGNHADESLSRSRQRLRAAAGAYEHAARGSRDRHWVWVQLLALRTVLDGPLVQGDEDWICARAAAADSDDHLGQGSLTELMILATWMDQDEAIGTARNHLSAFLARCGEDDHQAIQATRDQLRRYGEWWGQDASLKVPKEVVERADLCLEFFETQI